MAKPTTVKIRLNSTADTGHFYVTKKNARTMTEKMVVRKYDPIVRKQTDANFGSILKYAAVNELALSGFFNIFLNTNSQTFNVRFK